MTGIINKLVNHDIVLRIRFEDKTDTYGILPHEMRDLRLDAIYEYAKKHGFVEAARHAQEARKTNEDVTSVLREIGFTFDGKNFIL